MAVELWPTSWFHEPKFRLKKTQLFFFLMGRTHRTSGAGVDDIKCFSFTHLFFFPLESIEQRCHSYAKFFPRKQNLNKRVHCWCSIINEFNRKDSKEYFLKNQNYGIGCHGDDKCCYNYREVNDRHRCWVENWGIHTLFLVPEHLQSEEISFHGHAWDFVICKDFICLISWLLDETNDFHEFGETR